MAHSEPTAVIAPADEALGNPDDHLREVFLGAYREGVVLEYHGFRLVCESRTPRVWDVDSPEGYYVETLNLEAFRTATELQSVLDAIVAAAPTDREEWVGGSAGSQ